MQQQSVTLNPQQKFQKFLISTPLQQKYFTDISYKNVQQNLAKQLQKLIESSSFSHFDVYMGTQNTSSRSYLQQKYKRQQQILKLKIQQTKKNIYQISKANDEQQFDNAMKNFMKSMDIIKQRSQQVDHVDFVPAIYIQAKRKIPYYCHLMQEFNRKGTGMLNLMVGYRSPFTKLDKLQFKLQTPLANLRRKYFTIDLEWNNRHQKYGHLFAKVSHANANLFQDIDQKSHSFTLGTHKQQNSVRLQLQNKFRNPIIHGRFDQNCTKDYHLPSFKSAFKLTKIWQNTIEFNDINMGRYLQTKAQVTLPLISESQFAKLQLNYRQFFDLFNLKQYFDNSLIKKALFNSSLQTNLSWNLIKSFSNHYVSDINETVDVRGFQKPRFPVQTFSNVKLSAKFNLHNYPLIGQVRITPFLYANAGFSLFDLTKQRGKLINKNKLSQLYGLGSLGLGIGYYLNPYTQLQIIYNLVSYQNKSKRQSNNFQIRVGIFD